MTVLRLLQCSALILTVGACVPGGAQVPEDPPIQGLAEEQAAEGVDGSLGGSVGDPADTLEEPGEGTPGTVATAALEPPRRGLFGGLFGGADRSGSDDGTPEVAPGTTLPFAQVAEVCGVSARDLGTEVDEAPESGRSRFALIDPSPDTTGLRTQYVTGFSDRCARQFTGALVLFGSPDVHETTRYAEDNRRPYSETDTAYETLKSRICGVRPKVPCPADRAERMEQAAVFVTVYPQFGTSDEWFELLLSDGKLLAQGMNGR